jgi:hypothetical protein
VTCHSVPAVSRVSSTKSTPLKCKLDPDHSAVQQPSAKRSRHKKDALSLFNESIAKDSDDLHSVQKSQIEMQREHLAHAKRLQEMKIKAEERQQELDRQERTSQMQVQNQLVLNLLSRFMPPNPSHHGASSSFTFTPQSEGSFPDPNDSFGLFPFSLGSLPGNDGTR